MKRLTSIAWKGCGQAPWLSGPVQARIWGSIINEVGGGPPEASQNAVTARASQEGGVHVTALQRPSRTVQFVYFPAGVGDRQGGPREGTGAPRFPTPPRSTSPARSVSPSSRKPQIRIAGVPVGRGRLAPAGLSFVPARLRQPRSSVAGGAAARCLVHQHHLGAIRVAGVAPAGKRSAGLGESPRTSGN